MSCALTSLESGTTGPRRKQTLVVSVSAQLLTCGPVGGCPAMESKLKYSHLSTRRKITGCVFTPNRTVEHGVAYKGSF